MEVLGSYRVIADYNKKADNEISLKIGDLVEVFMRGQNVWYGRINNIRGFFPAKVVNSEQETTASDNIEGALQQKNTIKSEADSYDSCSSYTNNVKDEFHVIEETNLLNDNRKTRVRSKGRKPPSSIFLKNTILKRSSSEETITLSSDEDEHVYTDLPIQRSCSEIMHKQNLKHVPHKENSDQPTTDKPDWIKVLTNKVKILDTKPAKPKDVSSTIAPWIEEMRKRRESRGTSINKEGFNNNRTQQSTYYNPSETNAIKVENTSKYELQTSTVTKSMMEETEEKSSTASTTAENAKSNSFIHNTAVTSYLSEKDLVNDTKTNTEIKLDTSILTTNVIYETSTNTTTLSNSEIQKQKIQEKSHTQDKLNKETSMVTNKHVSTNQSFIEDSIHSEASKIMEESVKSDSAPSADRSEKHTNLTNVDNQSLHLRLDLSELFVSSKASVAETITNIEHINVQEETKHEEKASVVETITNKEHTNVQGEPKHEAKTSVAETITNKEHTNVQGKTKHEESLSEQNILSGVLINEAHEIAITKSNSIKNRDTIYETSKIETISDIHSNQTNKKLLRQDNIKTMEHLSELEEAISCAQIKNEATSEEQQRPNEICVTKTIISDKNKKILKQNAVETLSENYNSIEQIGETKTMQANKGFEKDNPQKVEQNNKPQKVDEQKINTEKVKLVLNRLDEFETQARERFLQIQNELQNLQKQADQHYEEVKAYVTQTKAQLHDIFKI